MAKIKRTARKYRIRDRKSKKRKTTKKIIRRGNPWKNFFGPIGKAMGF